MYLTVILLNFFMQGFIVGALLLIIASYRRSLRNAEECINGLMSLIDGTYKTVDPYSPETHEGLKKMYDKLEGK